ncbi:baculoviral IAP repeat-containing protein 5 [Uranotaenia lowii]|uniref:baculoviral IAP repeat-containing protein 5 n=1 Tax=Uranotaenia lowii TaxID=190385 RepID=UPI002478BE7B|nr:baculoviral IAP repeat-containing protein 5 [Uranotaenia lowii]
MQSSETAKKVLLFEADRIASFQTWPYSSKSACSIQKLAEAGFSWIGDGDENEEDTVICFVCGKVLDGWEETDDPWEEHKKHAPQCLFVKYGRPEGELTVEEMLNILEVLLKEKLQNKYESLRKTLKAHIEKKRKELIKQLTKN